MNSNCRPGEGEAKAGSWSPDGGPGLEEKIRQFARDLCQENIKHNLISRQASGEDIMMHVEDSLALQDFASLSGQKVIDIGSGGGFPGLILAMAEPEGDFTLLESDQKKSEFLKEEIGRLDLMNCQVAVVRAEEAGQDVKMREQYDCCTARAVAELRILLEYALPMLKVGGTAYFWKGRRWQEELNQAENAMESLGGRLKASHEYLWSNGVSRMLLVVEKAKPGPAKYPRRVGVPARRPL